MPLTFTAAMRPLLGERAHRFARIWKIERADGTTLRFTDHPQSLVFEDGQTYSPIGGGRATAKRRESGLREANLEYQSVISSEAITTDDLIAGRYRDAKVSEWIVDWRYPWVGSFQKFVYWITEVQFDGEKWVGQVSSIPGFLRFGVGDLVARNCRHELFSPLIDEFGRVGCGAVQSNFNPGWQKVFSVITQKSVFKVTNSLYPPYDTAGYFSDGYVVWTSGANEGLVSDIKSMVLDSGKYMISLQLETPHDIAANDLLEMYPGCSGTADECRDKFNNMVNHGGFQDMPGADATFQRP